MMLHCLPVRSPELVARIRAEFREMPGLSITLGQATRLWNADNRQCLDALESLANEGFLRCTRGSYVRTTPFRHVH
jgi:hypothetical protein